MQPEPPHSQNNERQLDRLTALTVEVAAEAMFTVSAEGVILAANQAACKRLEYSRDELVGLHVADFDPHYPKELWPGHFDDLRRDKTMVVETQHRSKHGKLIEVEVSIAFFELEGTEYCCSTIRDVTKRRQAELLSELQKRTLHQIAAAEPLQSVIDELCGQVEQLVPDTVAFVLLREPRTTCLRLYSGQKLGDKARGHLALVSIDKDQGTWIEAAKKRILVTSEETSAQPGESTTEVGEFPFASSWSTPILDDSGEVYGTITLAHQRSAVLSDFEENLLSISSDLASVAIRRSRADLQLQSTQFTIEQSKIAIYWIDRDGKIKFVNPAACEALGFSKGELLEMSVMDIAPDVTRENWPERSRMIVSVDHFESRHQRRNGVIFPVDLFSSELELDGEMMYVVFAHDITQRKLTEDRVRRQQAEVAHLNRLSTMGEMASSLAHELNQPLTAVVNYTEVIGQGLKGGMVPTEKLSSISDKATEQAMRAGEIVSSLRNLMKKTTPARKPTSIADLIQKCLLLLDPEMRHSGVDCNKDLLNDVVIEVDSIQIQQVIVNLLRNAIDAVQDCDVRQIEIRMEETATGKLHVYVTDSGAGVSTGDLERIFEPFQTSKAEGMGMGLSISRSIAAAHGGGLFCRKASSGGAEFCLVLPKVAESSHEGRQL